ncbi:MAG: phenylacetate--CoA ligase family protein [Candidatus Omnitrophica bacterium]|nr:phenylacetate--CoA ligase family protein [Candidatus Omnitrophota bacterium]
MNNIIYTSREELDELRNKKLRAQFLLCVQEVPFYKELYDRHGINADVVHTMRDLTSLPIVDKSVVRDRCLHPLYDKRRCLKSRSSGSTGEPFYTYFDRRSWFMKKYWVKYRARRACGMRFGDRVSIIDTDGDQALKKKNRLFALLFPFLNLRAFSIFDPLSITIQKIRTRKPTIIYSMPNYLFRLAREMERDGIPIDSVRLIFTSSEYLEKPVRSYIEKTFRAEVFDVYGSTEFKEIAWECERHEGYHINEDEVICEIVKDGVPVATGEIGDIVVTDLNNKAMPLIRFNTQDKGMLIDTPCSCGRTLALLKIYGGRASDNIYLPTGELIEAFRLTTSIEYIAGLLKYQIVQTSYDALFIKVITDNDTAGDEVRKIIEDTTHHTMQVDIERCESIELEKNGKYKVVKNSIDKS